MKSNILLSVTTVISDNECISLYLNDVIPALEKFVKNYEIIIVGNGLTDADLIKAKEEINKFRCIRLILLSENNSFDIALTAGIDSSIGDFVIIMDAYTDPAPDMNRLLKIAESGIDVVIAISGVKRYISLLHRFWGLVYFKIARLILPQSTDIDPSYFTCFSRKALNELIHNKDSLRSYRFLRSQIGFSRETIFYDPIIRSLNNRRKNSLLMMWINLDSLFAYSLLPLRFFSILSFILGGISYFFILYAVLSWLINPYTADGWTSTLMFFGFIFGSIFILLGIFGIYFGILLKEIKKIPLYHIKDEFDTGSAITDYKQRNIL
jgi:dolichol-phosphate mannosyltransferase